MKSMFSSTTGSLSPVLFAPMMALLLFGCCCCKKSEPNAFADPLSVYQERITAYHDASVGKQPTDVEGNQSVYVDFSDGIYSAVSTPVINNTIKSISQKLVGQTDWYALDQNLGGDGINKLSSPNDRDIYNQVTIETNYSGLMAPIDGALKRITSQKNDALLITDFEEYTPDGKEQFYAYAKKYFINWVKAGNSISFYYHIYTEVDSRTKKSKGTKNLYFAIFSYGPITENSILSKFKAALKNTAEESSLKYFEINPNTFQLKADYGGEEVTGLIPISDDDQESTAYSVGDESGNVTFYKNAWLQAPKKNFEVFEFGTPISMISEDFSKGFLGKLELDVSGTTVYQMNDIGIRVVDVTADYFKFVQWQEATKPENVPSEENKMLTRNNNDAKELKWDESKINDIVSTAYNTDKATLKPEFIYTRESSSGVEIKELFDIDKETTLKQAENSPSKIDIKIKFHKNYSPAGLDETEDKILRIDLMVNSNEQYPSQLDDFKWTSVVTKGTTNESLYEAVKITIQEARPNGVIYSYYLKLPKK
jgi:hypothetical protein